MRKKLKILILIVLVLNLIHEKSSFANNANQTIESFSKAKKILKKIHLEKPFTFYCQCKYEKNKPDWKSCGFLFKKNKKRASRIEWEHVLPASHFGIKFDTWKKGHANCISKSGKKYKGRKCTEKIYSKYRKMQSDLYNLQPAIGEVNGLRSNYQIGIINGENREFGKCDIEISNKIVEPTERIRGDFARTYLYMQNAYPNYIKFNNNIQKLIKKWDKDDPVDDWECLRAKKIKEFQGNLNIILHQRCLNKDTKDIQNKKNNLKIKSQSKNLIKENGNIKYSKTKSNIGSFNGKGNHDALK